MATVTLTNTSANLSGNTLLLEERDATITANHTFNRSPSAPFTVTSGSAVVTNLDVDKLDGQTGTYYTNAVNATNLNNLADLIISIEVFT
jgi:hypothetical protein